MRAIDSRVSPFVVRILAIFLVLSIDTASAATFELKTEKQGEYEFDVIYVSGAIESGDEKKFLELAMKARPDTLVWLNSPGGDLQPALQMGQVISVREFSTGVSGADCASACGLIWLSGKFRFLDKGGRVGFHSPYIVNEATGKPEVDSVGSALVGAYVRKLELPSTIAALVVEAPPDQITWATLSNAGSFGLIVYRLTDFNALDAYNKGYQASRNKNFDVAFRLYREAATSGFAGAQNNLGDLYEMGEGVPKSSDVMAVYWYTRAAERGEPFGYYSLATLLARTAIDKAGLVEAAMFGMLAGLQLPDGADRETAKKLVREIKSKLSKAEFESAIDRAKRWTPLTDDEFKLGAPDPAS